MKIQIVRNMLLIFPLIFIVGCMGTQKMEYTGMQSNENVNSIDEVINNEQEKTMNMDATLTPEQITILKAISVDEDAIDSGELKEWQKDVIRQLDYFEKALSHRYPSYGFSVESIIPMDRTKDFATITFYDKSNPSVFYSAELKISTEQDSYVERDDFWTFALKSPFEKVLGEYLASEGIKHDEIIVQFSGLQDSVFSEGLDTKEILNGDYKVNLVAKVNVKSTSINPQDFESYGKTVQEAIEKKNLYGYFETEVFDDQEERIDLFSYSFNTFQYR